MYLARVTGRVVSTVKQESLGAIPLLWIQPITSAGEHAGKPLIAIDRIGAGVGEAVVYITSREAAVTLADPFAAVDAGIIAKVDWCDVGGERRLGASEAQR
ncbi:MAG: EutN/CcmL family microcompartment protein [Gemmatimonadaceae bacterium]|nr:EutN/CcmL family microcompartment protein [Gemmatimonadaceae bacterium]